MHKIFAQLSSQFTEFFKSLPPVKRGAMLASSMVAVIGIGVVIMMLSSNSHDVLLSNVPPDQLPVVVDQLRQMNIPFKLEDSGKTIVVPTELLHSTQMAIMSSLGNSEIGNTGLELFDKQDFGVTSYAQRINFQRALQGELIRSINTLDAVKQSKVILALPPKKVFLEEGGDPSASVVVELHTGKSLTRDQVKGITHMVASSVENLVPEHVTVVDSRGKVLSKNQGAASAVSSDMLELKAKIENNLENRVEAILSRVVGAGKVIAKVDADINLQKISTLEETVDPDSTALRSSQSEEELLDGARNNPAGIPGARANLPGANEQGQVGFRQNVRKERNTQNFAVPKTTRNILENPGALKRVSIAVVVDGVKTFAKDAEGNVTETWKARDPADIAKYEDLVKNAVGFSVSRGDSVKVENIRFQEEDFSEADQLLTQLEQKKLLSSLFKWSILGFSLALFFFVVVRPFMRWVTDSFQDTVEDMLPRTIEELEELQSVDNTLPGMSGALPVLEESIDPDKAESELLKERIMALMEQDDEKAVGAFSLWLTRKDL